MNGSSAPRALKRARIERILAALSPREREALHRCYVLEQDDEQILRDLTFNRGEFRALKARVKKQFLLTN